MPRPPINTPFPPAAGGGGGGGTTSGVTDIKVSDPFSVSGDGTGTFSVAMAIAVVGDDGAPVTQAILFSNFGNSKLTTAYLVDTGGGVTVSSIAAKIAASVNLGALVAAGLVVVSIETTDAANDTCRITATGVGAGSTVSVRTQSAGLVVTITPGA